MNAKKNPAAASPEGKPTKKRAAAAERISAPKPGEENAAPKKTRIRRQAAPAAEQPPHEQAAAPSAVESGLAKPTKFFLGREGVAFGPYSEFQLRESVRLGLFESRDLVLAEDGKEWLEISCLLPARPSPREQAGLNPPPATPATLVTTATPVAAREDKAWTEVSLVLPGITAAKPRPIRRGTAPLSEFQLREHATLYAERPSASFMAELTRGRFAFAAVPVAAVVLGLIALAAMLKHHEPATRATVPPRAAQKSLAVQPLAKTGPVLTPISLTVGDSLAGSAWLPGSRETGALLPDPAGAPSH